MREPRQGRWRVREVADRTAGGKGKIGLLDPGQTTQTLGNRTNAAGGFLQGRNTRSQAIRLLPERVETCLDISGQGLDPAGDSIHPVVQLGLISILALIGNSLVL